MIGALQKVSWLSVRRDPVVLALTFVLPIAFYSVFAFIFGRMSSPGGIPKLEVVFVDEDGTETSKRLVRALAAFDAFSIKEDVSDRATAESSIRKGDAAAAIVLPKGFEATFAKKGIATLPIILIYDSAKPSARPMIGGLLQGAAEHAAPERLIERGLDQLAPFNAPMTDAQREALVALAPYLHGDKNWEERPGAKEDGPGWAPGAPKNRGLVPVDARDVRGGSEESGKTGEAGKTGKKQNAAAYYAAGIAVMFLLFSMSGAGGALLAEHEGGTLDRILTSRVSMGTLLGSYFLFFVTLGASQTFLMFTWGALVFDLELFLAHRLVGFVAMTIATASAAASFGLLLATLCRSRAQLSAISTVVILLMSALGGSMVPRFVMPPIMNTVALLTFNGWAIDGFLKVFWYDDPNGSIAATLVSLAPQLGALIAMSVVGFVLARRVARRWEAR